MPDEEEWLRAVDTLDLWLRSREEKALGNVEVDQMIEACEKVLVGRMNAGTLPEAVEAFFINERVNPTTRLSDYFDKAVTDGLGEAEA